MVNSIRSCSTIVRNWTCAPAASGTNQFDNGDVIYTSNGAKFSEESEPGTDLANFSYRWIGRMKNGLHIVLFTSGGGAGTMVANTLFFLRFSKAKAFRPASGSDDYPARLIDSKSITETSYTRLLMS